MFDRMEKEGEGFVLLRCWESNSDLPIIALVSRLSAPPSDILKQYLSAGKLRAYSLKARDLFLDVG
jgi:hypothetical protein